MSWEALLQITQGQAYFPDALIFRLSLDKGGKTGLKRFLREPESPSSPIGTGEEGWEVETGTEALSGEQGHWCRGITSRWCTACSISTATGHLTVKKPHLTGRSHTKPAHTQACQQTARLAPSSHRERDKASKEPGETDTQLNFKRLFSPSSFDSQGHKLGEELDK